MYDLDRFCHVIYKIKYLKDFSLNCDTFDHFDNHIITFRAGLFFVTAGIITNVSSIIDLNVVKVYGEYMYLSVCVWIPYKYSL